MSSDNPSGADNQQETRKGILRDCTPGAVDIPKIDGEGTVRPSWRHEEPDGNDLARFARFVEVFGVNREVSNNVPKLAKFLVG